MPAPSHCVLILIIIIACQAEPLKPEVQSRSKAPGAVAGQVELIFHEAIKQTRSHLQEAEILPEGSIRKSHPRQSHSHSLKQKQASAKPEHLGTARKNVPLSKESVFDNIDHKDAIGGLSEVQLAPKAAISELETVYIVLATLGCICLLCILLYVLYACCSSKGREQEASEIRTEAANLLTKRAEPRNSKDRIPPSARGSFSSAEDPSSPTSRGNILLASPHPGARRSAYGQDILLALDGDQAEPSRRASVFTLQVPEGAASGAAMTASPRGLPRSVYKPEESF